MKSGCMKLFATACIAAAAGCAGAAEQFPVKTIRVVTALSAGVDAYVRALAQRYSDQLGQPVVVENRPGGLFVPSTRAVADAAPDGSTVLIYSVIMFITKIVQPKVPFDPVAELAPVTKIYGEGASMLLVRPDSPFKNLNDLIAHAKVNPGKVSHGGQMASSSHLNAASLLAIAGAKAYHIPQKNVDDLTSLMRGELDFTFSVTTVSLPQVMAGKFRALAVTSGGRVRALPDVPTLRELLQNDLLVQDNWTGLAAPAKTPGEIVARWHAETVKALGDPMVLKAIDAGGNVPGAGETPQQFGAFVRREND